MDSLQRAYVLQFKDIAMDEMERSGVPASIKLAQGILESRAGTSELARAANNHFGIKCGKGWKGAHFSQNDDERDAAGRPMPSCFRQYDHVVACFADHSAFLQNPEKQHRYGLLFDLDPRDYKGWAQGLQKAGYSTANHYAESLTRIIERYSLHEYDQQVCTGRITLKRFATVHGVQLVQARAGETLRTIANQYNLPVENIVTYNDHAYGPDQPLGMGDRVFVQEKHSVCPKTPLEHRLEQGQSLFDVAQIHALRLDALRVRNRWQPGQEPAEGGRIVLRESIASPPQTTAKGLPASTPTPTPAVAGPAQAFVVEMLPEQPLNAPIPAAAETPSSVQEPQIVVNMKTGVVELYHTVAKGDTLASIARRYSSSAARIRALNNLNGNIIRAGQVLRVE